MADRRSGHGRPGRPPAAGSATGIASLVGGGPSLVGPVGAMRARDVSRPRETDYARAEKTVVVRRRPPDPPPVVQSSDGASEPADS